MAQGLTQSSVVKLSQMEWTVVANDEGETSAREVFPSVSFCASVKISYLSDMRFLIFGIFFFFLIQNE